MKDEPNSWTLRGNVVSLRIRGARVRDVVLGWRSGPGRVRRVRVAHGTRATTRGYLDDGRWNLLSIRIQIHSVRLGTAHRTIQLRQLAVDAVGIRNYENYSIRRFSGTYASSVVGQNGGYLGIGAAAARMMLRVPFLPGPRA